MDLKLTDKLALVTGSTAGIGFAIAQALAREGARVIVNGRAQASVDQVVDQLAASTGAVVQGFAGDLTRAADAEALAKQFPGVEILVNNLGIFEPKRSRTSATPTGPASLRPMSSVAHAWRGSTCRPCGGPTGAGYSSSPAKARCRFRPR